MKLIFTAMSPNLSLKQIHALYYISTVLKRVITFGGKRRDLLFARLTFDITIRRQLFSIKGKQTIHGRTINSVYKCTLLELDVVLTGRHYNLTKLQLVAVTTGRRYNWTSLQLDAVTTGHRYGRCYGPSYSQGQFFWTPNFFTHNFYPLNFYNRIFLNLKNFYLKIFCAQIILTQNII